MSKIIRQRKTWKYGTNLWGLSFLVSAIYTLLSGLNHGVLIIFGGFLLFEHVWNWGEFSFWDFIGHEWAGLFFVTIGMFFYFNWYGLMFLLIFLGLNISFDKSEFSKELKEIWRRWSK